MDTIKRKDNENEPSCVCGWCPALFGNEFFLDAARLKLTIKQGVFPLRSRSSAAIQK